MNNYYKEEVECVHMYLDDRDVSREKDNKELSLVGRIKQLEYKYLELMSALETHYLNEIKNKQ